MVFLIAQLCVTVESVNKKLNEHLISLRDYDFVGEDQRLSALLAERMAVLQAPLNLSDLDTSGPGPKPAGPWPQAPNPFQPKPDYLHSNVRFPQLVNVSMDYAELYNESDWLLEVNTSLLALVPKPGGAAAPGTGSAPAPRHDARLGRVDGRRQTFRDPSFQDYNNKILDIMKQCIYTTQRKVLELDPLVDKYQLDPRFRMAFIYNRLDEWLHDMRTVLFSTLKYRYYPRRVKRVIWYYEHMLRLNIDITYSIEHLLHLHSEYMKNLEIILPSGQREQFQKMKKEHMNLKEIQDHRLATGKLYPKH